MRFHKFKTHDELEVFINLDQVSAVEQGAPFSRGKCRIHIGGYCWQLSDTFDDVMALISPAAAPDPYEAELRAGILKQLREDGPGPIIETQADRHNEAHADEAWAKMTPGEIENVARRDELDKLMQMFRDPFGFNPVTRYVEDRRRELEAQQQAAQAPEAMSQSDRQARIDELERLLHWWASGDGSLSLYAIRRRAEIERA